jgi:hypothetical protein
MLFFAVTYGLLHSCEFCDKTDWKNWNNTWASTHYGNNASFILSNVPSLANDFDLDGIVDAFDNCPKWNPDQSDLDGDGVGDVCDNCNPTTVPACAAAPGLCANPNQKNNDGDNLGDICDPCPTNPAATDSDSDGVPDGCDVLPTADPPLPTCGLMQACPAALGQQCLLDGPNGVCAKQADGDLDGIADLADLCQKTTNADNTNTNAIIEKFWNVDPKADPCDPAPNARLAFVPIIPPNNPLPVKVTQANFTVRGTAGKPEPATLGGPEAPTKVFAGKTIFRSCNCYDPFQGLQTTEVSCVVPAFCPADQLTTSSRWRKISVKTNGPGSGYVPEAGVPTLFDNHVLGAPQGLTWEGHQDLATNALLGTLAPDGIWHAALGAESSAPPSTSTFMWPQTSRELNNNLRDSFVLVAWGGEIKGSTHLTGKVTMPSGCAGNPMCGMDIIYDPSEVINPGYGYPLQRNPSIAAIVDSHAVATWGGRLLDISQSANPAFVAQLGTPRVRLAPVESRARLEQVGLSHVQSASLPLLVDATTVPDVLEASAGGYVLSGRFRGAVGPLVAASLSVEATTGPSVPVSRFVAAYSATRQQVLVAGGQRAGGGSHTIWRVDTATGEWAPAVHLATPGPVGEALAMAWDAERNVAFVMTSTEGSARLVAYDINNDTAAVLGSWPHVKKHDRVFLNVLDDGQLAMTLSAKHAHVVFRFRIEGKKLKPTGVSAGAWAVVQQPVLGQRELFLPLIDAKERLSFEPISFFPGAPCSEI